MMAFTATAWKKQKPGEIRWVPQPTERPGQHPKRVMNYAALSTKHQPLPKPDLNSSAITNNGPYFTSASTFQEESYSKKNSQLCSFRAAVITFVIIVLIIVAAGVAIGVVLGTVGSATSTSSMRTTAGSGTAVGNGATVATGNQSSFSTALVVTVGSTISIGSQTGPPCSSYTTIDDPSRNSGPTGLAGSCDRSPTFNSTNGGAWIRFVGSGGTMMPTTTAGVNRCGGFLAGWFNGTLPTVPATQNNASVCFANYADPCFLSMDISVAYCSGGFYIYFLPPVPICNSRYCTA